MPRFIPLHTFNSFFESHSSLLSEGGMENFIARIKKNDVIEVLTKEKISTSEFEIFVESLKNPSVVIFHGWIEQNEELLSLLLGTDKTSSTNFSDKSGSLNHQLTNDFKHFISPFLAERLLSFTDRADEDCARAFSYVELLDTNHRALIESQLFNNVRKRVTTFEKNQLKIIDEQELINLVKPLCSKDILFMVNSFSKASYALKIGYVDAILNSVHSPGCTTRLANWIFKKLEEISLNSEHEDKIDELKLALKSGEIEVRNHGKGKTPIRYKKVISNSLILLIGFLVFYIIYFKPFNNVGDQDLISTSSFKQFTKEERKEIDSLLQTVDTGFKVDDIEIDPGIPIYGGGPTLQLRKAFKNDLMESIYDDLSKDAAIHLSITLDSCNEKKTKFNAYIGVKDLKKRNANVEAVVRNESDYDVIFYISENKKKGSVFSFLLKQGDVKSFEINENDIITTIAGNHFTEFLAPSTNQPLPSSKFKHHFCEQDVSYQESINTSFKLSNSSKKKPKFMIKGSAGSFYRMVDIYGVLTAY